jgi:NAD(P)-dependent dehydrogenase (short-subunit alcohol dehydrogenase family)
MHAPRQTPLGTGFGPRTEPAEVLAGTDLRGRNAIVTGGYSGIGLETVRALAGAGVAVTVPARSPEKARVALGGIEGVRLETMDLGDLASVRAFAERYGEDHDRLDLLINNAGIMACPETRVGPGWEAQFGVNHLGHFALAKALLPRLEAAEAPRVVALSSIGHRLSDVRWDDPHFEREPYDKWLAYGQAKTANALFAVGLDARLRPASGRAFSVHPGGIFTPLQRHLATEEMAALGWVDEHGEPSAAARAAFKTPTQGASTTLWAATAPALADHGGEYCEDCDVAALAEAGDRAPAGVRPWAVDPDSAERLWALSEALVATG